MNSKSSATARVEWSDIDRKITADFVNKQILSQIDSTDSEVANEDSIKTDTEDDEESVELVGMQLTERSELAKERRKTILANIKKATTLKTFATLQKSLVDAN